jgi:hypothetical protein
MVVCCGVYYLSLSGTGFFKRHFLNNPPLQLVKATPAELCATGQVRLDAREKNKKCRCVTARTIICRLDWYLQASAI